MTPTSTETLTGLIDRVTFHNPENGFCVLKVKIKSQKDMATLIGHCAVVTAGEWIQATGIWIQDRKFGQQFKAESLQVTPPTTLEGIEKYLGSGIVKGIGPATAKKFLKTFGNAIFTIIEEQPEKLKAIGGLGNSRIARIQASWAEQKAVRDIMLFLHSHGISPTRAVRIQKKYGEGAIEKIRENPYRLAQDIQGIGFTISDQIGASLGVKKTSILRARAGVNHALLKARENGHCGLPTGELIRSCQALLEVDINLIEEALGLELKAETIIQGAIQDVPCIFPAALYYSEKGIATRLMKLAQGKLPWEEIEAQEALTWIQKEHAIDLSPSQRTALAQALASKVMIITGGPGVGKTTLLRSLLKILQSKDVKILLAAPTGRAAKRLTEATGLEAKTIHRLLEMNPIFGCFQKDEESSLDCNLVVIDEVSMVDVPLFYSLLKAIPEHAALLLVGDSDQLPSVGPGQVLGDLIASNTLPFIHLTEVFRQAASSSIISVAHTLNQGVMPKLQGYGLDSDFFFIETLEAEDTLTTILDLATRRLPEKLGLSPLNDIQILTPMSRGIVGTRNLNMELQKTLNPVVENSLDRFGVSYRINDKVMQIKNNYDKDVYNGDIGFIRHIDHEEGDVIISFDGRDVPYDMATEMDDIVLSYAMTIHKSQGSEYPVVVIPLVTQHHIMLQKNLIYTAITRGKKLVILVGQKRAMTMTVHNNKAQKRWSLLKDRLQQWEGEVSI
jgi:exodeoxyribonuclease V alpha subunit